MLAEGNQRGIQIYCSDRLQSANPRALARQISALPNIAIPQNQLVRTFRTLRRTSHRIQGLRSLRNPFAQVLDLNDPDFSMNGPSTASTPYCPDSDGEYPTLGGRCIPGAETTSKVYAFDDQIGPDDVAITQLLPHPSPAPAAVLPPAQIPVLPDDDEFVHPFPYNASDVINAARGNAVQPSTRKTSTTVRPAAAAASLLALVRAPLVPVQTTARPATTTTRTSSASTTRTTSPTTTARVVLPVVQLSAYFKPTNFSGPYWDEDSIATLPLPVGQNMRGGNSADKTTISVHFLILVAAIFYLI